MSVSAASTSFSTGLHLHRDAPSRSTSGAGVDDRSHDCIIFTGYVRKGYGQVKYQGRVVQAHRLAYVLAGKPLAKKKHLHHTCENKLCINPDHLQLTRPGEHLTRFHRRERCIRGHRLSGRNVLVRKDGRTCRTCVNEGQRRRYSSESHKKAVAHDVFI